MLVRLLVALVLVPIGLALIVLGGIPYFLMVALLAGLAAWEYQRLFRAGGLRPAGALLILGALLIVFGRALDGFNSSPWIISLLILSAMTYHLVAYECGRDQAATDFGVTISGALYIGWLGAYLISLRGLPEGAWWVLVVLPGVWLIDIGAYLIGSRFGRHRLSPRLSPKKSWEGLLGGLIAGTLGTALLAGVLRFWTEPASAITLERGAVLGFLLALLTPLGDLGESMIKRQVGMKDSSQLLPGHGGVFDRIDSWLWAGVIGYYVIVWLFI
jgi:phosphatidate cytidylyltransferase